MEPKTDLEHIRKQVEKQVENLDWDKVVKKAKEKRAELSNIVSMEGAIHIVLGELHPEFRLSATRMTGTEVKGRLVNKTKPRFVDTKNAKQQPIRDVYIATDGLGVLRATLWGKTQVELFKGIEHGDAVLLSDVKVTMVDGESVLKVFKNSEVEKLDDKDVPAMNELLGPVNVGAVKVSEIGVLSGVIVAATKIEYDSCPVCGGKLSEVEDTYYCNAHQQVMPVHKEALDVTVDTGTGVFQTMFWPELLEGQVKPKQLDLVSFVCRVYDANHFSREKARKEGGVSDEVLEKQFPRDIRVTCYSFAVVQKPGAKKPEKGAASDKPVKIEDID